jgi:phage N-6-adenine-methyltransferase
MTGVSVNTPREWWEALNRVHDFTLDVAADDDNHLCDRYFTEKDNALAQEWHGRVWMAPPWLEPALYRWVWKAHDEFMLGNAEFVVMLLPTRTSSRWYKQFVEGIKAIVIAVNVPYEIPDGYEIEDQMLVIFGHPYAEICRRAFASLGEG